MNTIRISLANVETKEFGKIVKDVINVKWAADGFSGEGEIILHNQPVKVVKSKNNDWKEEGLQPQNLPYLNNSQCRSMIKRLKMLTGNALSSVLEMLEYNGFEVEYNCVEQDWRVVATTSYDF